MGNHLTKCCCQCPLESEQREKLEKIFHHITSNAPVDYSNQEIKDIHNAVSIMMERIRTRVNRRGILNIDRIVPSGSAVEKTSLWKFSDENHYLEFDFLSILKNTIKQCEDQPSRQHCQGCITKVNPLVGLESLRLYYYREGKFSAETLKERRVISDLFFIEINHCLTSSCDCLSIQCDTDRCGDYHEYHISFRPSSVEHNRECGKCTVNMSTGTLHVNTKIDIYPRSSGPNACSLIFQWISKIMTLSAPDKLLLQKPQPIYSLPIFIDFLPALESLEPTSPGAGDEHDFFIIPKNCNVCFAETFFNRWRKSWCIAEIHAFTQDMSDKHKRCYQIMKYLSEMRWFDSSPNYHIKTVVLRHHATCSNTTDDCVDCVMRIYRDLLQAYKTKELLSYQSNLNILKRLYADNMDGIYINRCESVINKLCSVSVTDTWETFLRKMGVRTSQQPFFC